MNRRNEVEEIAKRTTLRGTGIKTLLIFRNNQHREYYFRTSARKNGITKVIKEKYEFDQHNNTYVARTEAEILNNRITGQVFKDYKFMEE